MPDGEEEMEPEGSGIGSTGVISPPISSGSDSTGDEDVVSSAWLPAVDPVRREDIVELRRLEFSPEFVSSCGEVVCPKDVVLSEWDEGS